MAVSDTQPYVEYLSNGTATVYAIPFRLITASDLGVYLDGAQVVSGYTISGVGANTGQITFATAPAAGTLTLLRDVPLERSTDYQTNGDLLAKTLNLDLDRLWCALQDGFRSIGRAMVRPFFKDYFDAEGYRIANLADPTDVQDAVTKYWAQQYIAALLETGQGPTNNASNVIYVDPNGLDIRTVQQLSAKNSTSLGAFLVGYRARTVGSKLDDYVSVKDFGAKGDGTTDDYLAILAAHTYSKFVYYPPGVYLCNSQVVLADKDTCIKGAGPGLSEIRFGAVATGFSATFSNSIRVLMVGDIKITTTQKGVGVGLLATWPEDFDHGFQGRLYFDNVTFAGGDDYTQGWATCARIVQCDNASFVACTFKGVGGAPGNFTQAANTVSAHGLEILGRYSPTDFHLTNCWFYCLQDGVYVGDTAEGVILSNCTFVEVMHGVTWATGLWSDSYPTNPGGNASGRPQLVMVGCHVNCFQKAVATNGVVSGHIADCLFYHIDRATQSGNLIEIVNATNWSIHDTELWTFNSTYGTNGIVFGGNVSYSSIHDISIIASGGNIQQGVWLFSDCHDNVVKDIQLTGAVSGNVILDSGSKNAIGRRGTLAHQASAYAIPNNTSTPIGFSAVAYDSEGAWSASTASQIVVPKNAKRVRLTGGAVFDSNSTGVRQLNITKNGSVSYVGQGSAIVNAASGLATQMNVSTGIIDVVPGDIFRLAALQTSGGSLNVQGGATFLSLEILA